MHNFSHVVTVDAAIESLTQEDEYIPVQKCEEFLNHIEGLLTWHQQFVTQFLPPIDDVKSVLPLTARSEIAAIPSFPQIKQGNESTVREGEWQQK